MKLAHIKVCALCALKKMQCPMEKAKSPMHYGKDERLKEEKKH